MEKIRKKLLRKYASVFKRDLGKEDRIHMDPVKVELIDESRTMGNAMIPTETPRHLQDAAAEELGRLLKSGCLEPVHHSAPCREIQILCPTTRSIRVLRLF